jgi:hypothetical protein
VLQRAALTNFAGAPDLEIVAELVEVRPQLGQNHLIASNNLGGFNEGTRKRGGELAR